MKIWCFKIQDYITEKDLDSYIVEFDGTRYRLSGKSKKYGGVSRTLTKADAEKLGHIKKVAKKKRKKTKKSKK